ncbi:MAG: DUF2252 domain-containing protein [Methanoregula sp.]
MPVKSLAVCEFPEEDRDPLDILKKSNEGRLRKLIPIRNSRMSSNPFAFLRGSAAIMAHDLASGKESGIPVRACGDCHLANFGVFASPERNLVFDITDFDETYPAPFEWDVKRLVTSCYIAGAGNGFSRKACRTIVRACAATYRKTMIRFSRMKTLDRWYSRIENRRITASIPGLKTDKGNRTPDEEAVKRTFLVTPRTMQKKTDPFRIVDHEPLIYHPPGKWHLEDKVVAALEEYRRSLPYERRILYDRFSLEDVAVKVVGIGSVGTRCLILLFRGENNDRLLLQAKEARRSVLSDSAYGRKFDHNGERVVVGQRIMQSASDIFLGWMTSPGDGIQYYVRQLRDGKFSPDVETMSLRKLHRYSQLCGWTLARSHSRGGDSAVIAGYLGKGDGFERAMDDFSGSYAARVEKDYELFVESLKSEG